MDNRYSNGSYGYGDSSAAPSSHYPYSQQPSSYASLPNLRSAYDHQSQSQQPPLPLPPPTHAQQTLPPLHSQQQHPSGSSSSSFFDHYNPAKSQGGTYPSAAASQLTSGYANPGPFGGQFANYSHGELMPQQHNGYGMHHDTSAPGGYMGDMRSSGFGVGQTLPPLPATQPYGQPFGSGGYDQPSHVVGAQGRRGILPSDDGRPSAVAPDGAGASRATSFMPARDDEGKFPCPHCNKTYLHAKHLKRHLLRHTGDRPYSCFLCNDTFSRSDILKRHFQKCSIRRGNPTGASHLQNSQSHLRKQAAKRSSNDLGGKPGSSHDGTRSQPDSETNSLYSTSTSRPASDNFSSLRSDGRTDSSISTMSTPIREKSRSMTAPQPLASIKAEQVSSQPVTPSLPTGSPAASEAPFSANNGAIHGYPHRDVPLPTYRDSTGNVVNDIPSSSHGGSDFGWNSLAAQPVQNGGDFGHPYFSVATAEQDLLEGDHNFSSWPMTHQTDVSYHEVSARLIAYLQLDLQRDEESQVVQSLLSADNIEQFLNKYLNFHQHWPNIHMPTFNPLTSYPGLTLAMCTVGAAYSDVVSLAQVRILLRKVKPHIYTVSEIGRAAHGLVSGAAIDLSQFLMAPEIFEQLAALGILSKMVLWHTEPENRRALNADHASICQVVKHLQMLEPVPRHIAGFSELHQADTQVTDANASANAAVFDYDSWLREEKRCRALWIIVQSDMAHSLYFNAQPNFRVDDIRLPLPADDAAWEAQNANDCSIALGLQGKGLQENYNIAGSRRVKQIEFHEAMKVLASSNQGFQPRSTNAYGKFMLVHGVHVLIWFVHHQQQPYSEDFFSNAHTGNSNHTSLSPADWITNSGLAPSGSVPNSGHATPTSESGTGSSTIQMLDRQLLKWRKHWDEDDLLEYPPSTPQPRVGFCRDGNPYFWLGRMLLKNIHLMDPAAGWEKRFMQMMAALKQSKNVSQNEGLNSGLGLTMLADTIDPQYGVDDLTLDMKLLFAPISPAGSPAPQANAFTSLGH